MSSQAAYNVGFNAIITGSLDLAALEAAVAMVCERQQVLRSHFITLDDAGNTVAQRVAPAAELPAPFAAAQLDANPEAYLDCSSGSAAVIPGAHWPTYSSLGDPPIPTNSSLNDVKSPLPCSTHVL